MSIVLVLCCSCVETASCGTAVFLNNGRSFSGTVSVEDDKVAVVCSDAEKVFIPWSMIKYMEGAQGDSGDPAPGGENTGVEPERLYEEGKRHYRNGDYEDALNVFKRLLLLSPEDTIAKGWARLAFRALDNKAANAPARAEQNVPRLSGDAVDLDEILKKVAMAAGVPVILEEQAVRKMYFGKKTTGARIKVLIRVKTEEDLPVEDFLDRVLASAGLVFKTGEDAILVSAP